MQLNTFSVVARCPCTGRIGVTVSTAVPAMGAICPFVQPGAGVVASQCWANPYLALDALALMAGGVAAQAAVDQVLSGDGGRALCQVGMVDAAGRSTAWTGDDCTPWCGHRTGDGYAVQGDLLAGEAVVTGMEATFLDAADSGLEEQPMRALQAGQAAGGDKRGKQSAAPKVYGREACPWLDLRVDVHPAPVAELRRVLSAAMLPLRLFVDAMPTWEDMAAAAGPRRRLPNCGRAALAIGASP